MIYYLIFVIAVLEALFVGYKRRIGVWWALFFCIFFGGIIGLGLVLGSSKEKLLLKGYKPHDSKKVRLASPILLLLSGILFYYGLVNLNAYYTMLLLMPAVGFFGGFIYLLTTYGRAYTNNENESIAKQIDGLIVIIISCTFLVCMTTKW